MMDPVHRIQGDGASATRGVVELDPGKACWNVGMILLAIIFAPFTFSMVSFIFFLTLTYFSLLIGHSVGMHRMMIHRTFECHPLVEKTLIYIGVLVGMSSPKGIIAIHDTRDWAQRQEECHDFFSHKKYYLLDLWWQLTSRFSFESPPKLEIEAKYNQEKFYINLEKYWRLHQFLLSLVFYLIGGWSLVVWGIFVRVSISIIGHWTITYFCHNPGPGLWHVKDAAVQASNIPGLGMLTYGECWHNNHHAFPESARIGIEPGQSDPAWYFIKGLAYLGLARNIGVPRPSVNRDDLIRISK
ncbi:MAG: acyl-CoA desaturase [Kangiellaceae bacterium]|nr:acyl-CoA desaturase [Kangiellaceae bacterium]